MRIEESMGILWKNVRAEKFYWVEQLGWFVIAHGKVGDDSYDLVFGPSEKEPTDDMLRRAEEVLRMAKLPEKNIYRIPQPLPIKKLDETGAH